MPPRIADDPLKIKELAQKTSFEPVIGLGRAFGGLILVFSLSDSKPVHGLIIYLHVVLNAVVIVEDMIKTAPPVCVILSGYGQAE